MNQNKKIPREFKAINLFSFFIKWSIVIFIAKLVVLANIPGGFWNAADGDNYIKGVEALINDGIFAKEINLTYWPAGYPLFLLLLSFFGESWLFATLTILQSAIYSFDTFFFAQQLLKTKFSKYSFLVFILIILNPTLSLSTLAIGYEAPIAACFMMIAGIIWANINPTYDKKFWLSVAYVGGWFALAIVGLLGALDCLT